MSQVPDSRDPFREARLKHGILLCPFQGEIVPMLLRHADIKEAARDWHTFSSDAPFRVPIPSEEQVRTTRQLPIETNPPDHDDYRDIIQPWFQRSRRADVIASVEAIADRAVVAAMGRDSVEVVNELALPVQSRALTHMLNVRESEADTWIGWGIHVFRNLSGEFKKGMVLEDYLRAQFDRAAAEPGDDFFGALARASFRGRPLTRDEMMGFANLVFAGGRDTIIHSISSIIHHLGQHPEDLEYLREDPERIVLASEEFFRIFAPLTHIGRVCPVDAIVHGYPVKAGGRVSLAWASANFDETVFDAPREIRLDRRPNPHISFGVGAHQCIGSAQARLAVRGVMQSIVQRVARITVLEAHEHIEREAAYERSNGFDSLIVRLTPR